MYNFKYVFSQLTAFLNRSKFNRLVSKYNGDRYVKHFSCWNQLLTLMFGQLSNRESLRELIVSIEAHHRKWKHLDLANIKPEAIWQRPTPTETIASSRNMHTTLSVKPGARGRRTYSCLMEMSMPLIPRPSRYV